MKRFYFAVFLLLALGGACALLNVSMASETQALQQSAIEVAAFAEQGKLASADNALKKLSDRWQKSDFLFHVISGRDHCDKVESALTRSEYSIKNKDSSELLFAVSELSEVLDGLLKTQDLSVRNLF